MPWNQCFVCTGEIQNPISGVDENSILLCQILEIPHLRAGKSKEFQEISYCHDCANRILSIRDMLEELEGLEKKVLDEKYLIEMQLKNYSKISNSSSTDQFKLQIVSELRSTSMESMLKKIQKKRVGRKLCRPRNVQIMENVSIPRISSPLLNPHGETIVNTDRPESFTFEDSSVRNQSVPSSDDFGGTIISSTPETPWTSEVEECDIKLEAMDTEQVDEYGDPLQFMGREFDFGRRDNFIVPDPTDPGVGTTPEDVLTGGYPQVEYYTEVPSNPLDRNSSGSSSTSTYPRQNREGPNLNRDLTKVIPSDTDAKFLTSRTNSASASATEAKAEPFRNHRIFPSLEGYKDMLRILKQRKGDPSENKNKFEKMNIQSHFYIEIINGEERIKSKKSKKKIIIREEIPTIMETYHDKTGHPGRDKTIKRIQADWHQIPKDTVTQYLKACKVCLERKSIPKTNAGSLLSSNPNI